MEGDGEPLVLHHPSAMSSSVWWGLGYVRALGSRYRLVLIDGRGHGQSDKPRDEDAYALDVMASDVVCVLDALEIDRAHYLGYSLGGRLGLQLGVSAPERFVSLALGGASHRPQRGALDRLVFPGCLETIEQSGIPGLLEAWSRRLGRPLPHTLESVLLTQDATGLVPYLRRTDREPGFLLDELSTIDLPVLLFAGVRDEELLSDSEAVAAVLPRAQLVSIPGEDHFSVLVKPGGILPHITAFLARASDRDRVRSG
jgi:pimeloyl-ACP methyl ester carboxylesterase